MHSSFAKKNAVLGGVLGVQYLVQLLSVSDACPTGTGSLCIFPNVPYVGSSILPDIPKRLQRSHYV